MFGSLIQHWAQRSGYFSFPSNASRIDSAKGLVYFKAFLLWLTSTFLQLRDFLDLFISGFMVGFPCTKQRGSRNCRKTKRKQAKKTKWKNTTEFHRQCSSVNAHSRQRWFNSIQRTLALHLSQSMANKKMPWPLVWCLENDTPWKLWKDCQIPCRPFVTRVSFTTHLVTHATLGSVDGLAYFRQAKNSKVSNDTCLTAFIFALFGFRLFHC